MSAVAQAIERCGASIISGVSIAWASVGHISIRRQTTVCRGPVSLRVLATGKRGLSPFDINSEDGGIAREVDHETC